MTTCMQHAMFGGVLTVLRVTVLLLPFMCPVRALSKAADEGLLTSGFFWIPSLGGPTSMTMRQAVRQQHTQRERSCCQRSVAACSRVLRGVGWVLCGGPGARVRGTHPAAASPVQDHMLTFCC